MQQAVSAYAGDPTMISQEILECHSPATRIRATIFIFSPISFTVGSPGLWYSQPLAQTTVPLAGLWVLIVNAIIQFASLLGRGGHSFGANYPGFAGPPGSVSMSLPELAKFLQQLKKGTLETAEIYDTPERPERPGVQVEAPIWLTVFLLLTGYVDKGEDTPRFSLFIPVIKFRGITGGLPILIMGLIATILVCSVVPPSTSGVHPLPEPKKEPKFQFSLPEVLNLIKSYNHYFK